MKRQIGIKLEPGLIELLDQEADRRQINRTELIELACNLLVGARIAEGAVPSAGSSSAFERSDEEPPYRCPGIGCSYRAASKAAICPTHGRRLVLAGEE